MLTAAAAEPFLTDYVGAGNDYKQRLSLVIERLMKAGNYRGTKVPATFTVYADADNNPVITLPRELNAILAGVYVSATNTAHGTCGRGLPVRNAWYQFVPAGPGMESGLCLDSFVEMPGRWRTFRDWVTPQLLRFKFERNENAGTLLIRGTLEGTKIFSANGSTWIDGVALAFGGSPANATTVTTTHLFDRPPTFLQKPTTNGRVSMYTVDSDGTETLVAVYEPTEKHPAWRRYKVPACTTPVNLMLPASQFYTKADIMAMFGDTDALTANTDATIQLSPPNPFVEWTQPVTAQAGAAPYVYKLVLGTTYPLENATYKIPIDLAQSNNPTIEIYDGATNILLQTVNGDSSNPTDFYFEAVFRDDAWTKVTGYFVP